MEVMAGTFPTQVLQPKTIARITTGAPVPEGANAVIKVRFFFPAMPTSLPVYFTAP